MYRYLALIWNPRDAGSAAGAQYLLGCMQDSRPQWTCPLQVEGVAVFHTGLGTSACETLILPDAAGVVLGKIFNRDFDTPQAALRVGFDSTETTKLVERGGRRLFERYWGRYVALIRDAATAEVCVLRDPSGALPCFHALHRGVHVIFADLEDCLAIAPLRMEVNWSFIAAVVAHAGMQTRATALAGVGEILPGERVRFSAVSVQRSMEWNPIDIARSEPIEDPGQAITALRHTTRSCIHAWAACYRGIVHNLSGGLDSSIVLSCLSSAPTRPALTCLHYFGTGPGEDERAYARMMAQRTGVELIELPLDAQAVRLEGLLRLRRSARPWFYLYELEHGRFESELVARLGPEGDPRALFSGAGGDGVFFQAHAELAVTDQLFQHGLFAPGAGSGLLRVAVDAACVARKSVWPLLFGALRSRFLRRRLDPATLDPVILAREVPRTLVNRNVLDRLASDADDPVHPWLSQAATRGVPPGILWHVMSITMPLSYYSSFSREVSAERTLPLLSQPLVELCLRIPTYVLIQSGRDRAVARRAFADELPREIVRRQGKGRADQHVRNILDRNLAFVREMLLDGILVREGLLNRRSLERYLTPGESPADHQYIEILQEHLCTEVWLRSWLGAERPRELLVPAAATPAH